MAGLPPTVPLTPTPKGPPPVNIEEVILSELRALTVTVNELAADSKQRITSLETQVHPLFDNGQPGRCNVMEKRVAALEHWKTYMSGINATVSAAVSGIVVLALKYIF